MRQFIQDLMMEIIEIPNVFIITNGFQASQEHLKSAEKVIRIEAWKLQQYGVFTRWLFPRHQSEIREKLDDSLKAVIEVDTKIQMARVYSERIIIDMRNLMEMLNTSSISRLDNGVQLDVIEEGLTALTEVNELWREVRMDKVRALL